MSGSRYGTLLADMPGSKYAFDHCLTLPMYFEMTDHEQDFVVGELAE